MTEQAAKWRLPSWQKNEPAIEIPRSNCTTLLKAFAVVQEAATLAVATKLYTK
jgi:hypothetical protein